MSSIESVISGFRSISLDEMDAVALMNRVDTKYPVSVDVAASVLRKLTGDHRVLDIDGKRLFQYRTVYFDTDDQQMLHEHLRGKLNRKKIRTREYVGSGVRFFEFKRKTNKGRTVKSRIPKQTEMHSLGPEEAAFLRSVSSEEMKALNPVIEVQFNRVTLVSLGLRERITFDFQVSFSAQGQAKEVDNLVIVEVKRASESGSGSMAMDVLKGLGSQPSSLSKYCLGMILLNQTPRYNRYKPKLLTLNKISTNGTIW